MNKSSPRTFKITNTFTEDECKYIQRKMNGYEIKYNSFHEINKKYLTQQTKQELYDTCVSQKKCVKEREDYIENIENIVRKLDKIMNEQKKTIEDLNLINDGLSEQVEEYEEGLEKVNVIEEKVEKLQEQIKTYEKIIFVQNNAIEQNRMNEINLMEEIETLKEHEKKKVVKKEVEKSVQKKVQKEEKKKVVKKEVKFKNNLDEMNDILKKYS